MTQTMEIALVGAAAAIVGGLFWGLLSGAYQHWRDHFSRPKLEIDYEGTAANKVEIISEKIDGIDPGAVFIRACRGSNQNQPVMVELKPATFFV